MISVVSLILSCCISLNAASINSGSEVCENIAFDSCTNEEVFSFTPPTQNRQIHPGCDDYESNDNYNEATNLSPENYYLISSYNTYLEANVDWYGFPDKDYYYFKLFVDCYVDLTVDIYGEDDYLKFVLLCDDYSFDGVRYYTDYSEINIDYNQTFVKQYSALMNPGTYVIFIERLFENNYSTIDYSLDLTVTKNTTGYGNHTVGELKYNKGLQGACWLNDFVPLNNPLYLYDTRQSIYNTSLEPTNYALNELEALNTDEPYLIKEYYIWGSELKTVIYEILTTIHQSFLVNYNNQNQQIRQIELTRDFVNNCITIVCTIGGVICGSKIIGSLSFATLSIFGPMISDHIFNMFIPSFGIEDLYFTSVINYYRGLLNNSNDGEVIYLPVYCTLSDEIIPLCQRSYSFTTKDSLEIIDAEECYIFEEDCIYALGRGPSYLKGKVYGLAVEDSSSISYILADDLNDITPTSITFNNVGGHFDVVLHGGYQWLTFTAVSTKDYYFHFQSTSTQNFFVEQFPSIVPGYSTSGRTKVYSVNATNSVSNEKIVFFHLFSTTNTVIYFRVMGVGLCSLNIDYGLGDISAYINHVHNYSDLYSWVSYTQHDAFCVCGSYHREGHVVSAYNLQNTIPDGSGYTLVPCLLCGGMARIGFIPGPLTMLRLDGFTYYLCDNDIIILFDGGE